eukprot:3139825-Prymnesium_polylepis.2
MCHITGGHAATAWCADIHATAVDTALPASRVQTVQLSWAWGWGGPGRGPQGQAPGASGCSARGRGDLERMSDSRFGSCILIMSVCTQYG